MTTAPRENMLDWLRDAHAMEQQAEQMLESQIKRIEHYPLLRERLEQHLMDTRQQQHALGDAIRRLGGEPSSTKDLKAQVVAFGQSLTGMMASDEIVKGAISGYVFEQMEIANYTALIAAAQATGDDATAQTCQRILAQEQAMAQWLLEHLPEVVQQFLALSATEDVDAKR